MPRAVSASHKVPVSTYLGMLVLEHGVFVATPAVAREFEGGCHVGPDKVREAATLLPVSVPNVRTTG